MKRFSAGILAAVLMSACGGEVTHHATHHRLKATEMTALRHQLSMLAQAVATDDNANASSAAPIQNAAVHGTPSRERKCPAAVPQDPIPCNPGGPGAQ